MVSPENESPSNRIFELDELPSPRQAYMQKFRLYQTRSNFYMIGRDKSRSYWRVLKIDRLDPSELNVSEDSAVYTESECFDLLIRMHEGNKTTGGLRFVTTCYGIVGFVRFLGPYYMLLITKRRQIGVICGHSVYAISRSAIIPLRNSFVQSNVVNSKSENRYKKLLGTVDLTKDFFFSYSYHIMRSLQKNLCDNVEGPVVYETMFVWNEFLTRGIRNHLQNTLWTVALVYGFFKQATLNVAERCLKLTLIARRSRHYAGTRYLKRGVNEKGRVANDVETEQIVFEEAHGRFPIQISSVVQNRGSIPLFWSQETSRLNLKPDIILPKKDQNYEATRLHFENLAKRYGNPIIVLNLIKTREKKPRESILRAEFGTAIDFINKDLSDESRLRFLHWDLHEHSQRNTADVLSLLGKVASYALLLTGFFYYPIMPDMIPERIDSDLSSTHNFGKTDDDESNILKMRFSGSSTNPTENAHTKYTGFQKGVLRTNCIDCLDRTNVAQYAYGLAALGQQLHAFGIMDASKIDLDAPLADELMELYERMGDTLAHQYSGSAAHNKIFSERRGQWRAATQSQEFLRTLQRYYSNAYVDAEKQDAINVFLGHFQPQPDKPALWELGSDQLLRMERNGRTNMEEKARPHLKRSLSDGNIVQENGSPMSAIDDVLSDRFERDNVLSESSPEISTSERDVSFSSRHPLSLPRKQLFGDEQHMYLSENQDALNSSNFVDMDWLSSSGTSCEEEPFERSSVCASSPALGLSSENIMTSSMMSFLTPTTSEYGSSTKETQQAVVSEASSSKRPQRSTVPGELPDSFVDWVMSGETLCH